MDVLLIIDMQEALFANQVRYDAQGVVRRINTLAAKIRSQDGKVIFIQHDGTREEGLAPHTHGWEILAQETVLRLLPIHHPHNQD